MTVYCYGAMVPVVEKAAARAKEQRGIDCLVVDLRTLLPLDEEGVIEAAKQTGRVVVVHEAPRFCGYGAEIGALIAEHCIEYMGARQARHRLRHPFPQHPRAPLPSRRPSGARRDRPSTTSDHLRLIRPTTARISSTTPQ